MNSRCAIAAWLECFQEKPSWCRNEQVCQGRKSVKRFERSNGLDTVLYKAIPLYANSNFMDRCIVFFDVTTSTLLVCLIIKHWIESLFYGAVVSVRYSARCCEAAVRASRT